MDKQLEMHEKLQQIIIEVCRYPTGSRERQKALNPLLILIQLLKEIAQSFGEQL